MGDRGDVRDTYAAALQHDLIDLAGDERLVGVVRRPLPWFDAQVEENRAALGPPESLLDEVKERSEALQAEGLEDATAHNRAMTEANYRERYLDHIRTSGAAQAVIEDLKALLESGQDVVLVCYENTDKKRCHRTILREYLMGTVLS
jgi:uncharacterized protein YeaO (DUF488 family)